MVEGARLTRPAYRLATRTTLGVALAASIVSLPLAAQDPVPPDPSPLDSLEVLPDSVREVFADTTPPRAQRFPGRLVPLLGPSNEVFRCDRDCVQSSPAFSLAELLSEFVPGLSWVRGGFFAGPHHAFDGPLGPGFGSLYIDGREIPSLERAQVDLRRLSLNYVEEVRVYRGADGFAVDVDLVRHEATGAYSRISGGTGDPQIQILDGIFANQLGTTFNLEGAFELLDVNTGTLENDRFGGLGRLSWMPRSNDFGVQLEFRLESVDRAGADTADVRRNEVVLRTRANLGSNA
ncbi:MAG: Plug domain-containing protein, partial [Gemmatimonadetes bacterium]|nr:Plug domain-containing protein [Gemmatimonadota bacterium]